MDWPADVRPDDLRQPDAVSCGPTSVVAARMLLEPSWRPTDLRAEVAATHHRLTSTHSARDRFQLPWPRRLGTPPWAVASALTALVGRERIAAVNVRPRPEIGFEVLLEQVRRRPVAVYLGSRWLPRHVVLAYATAGPDAVRLLDPARGELVTLPRERWESQRVGVAGWKYFWFVV